MRHPSQFAVDQVVVGCSVRMRGVFDFVRVISESASTVLITGESGTGKEVIANLIHHSGPRRHMPFVPVGCALFSETLIETELFGHERGAFTGAIRDKAGRFELAAGGTIFLDDVDDVPLAVQVKLLRVLQSRTVERVGGTRTLPIDLRVIAGAKRDLRRLVSEGKFREDLYYRLNVLPIVLPPLRERREDIPILMDHFLRRHFEARGEPLPDIAPAVRQAFLQYPWPGNVRELEHACERIAQTCTCGAVRIGCVAATVLLGSDGRGPMPDAAGLDDTPVHAVSLEDRLREVETSLISWALRMSTGNKSKAAELLKIKRSTLGDRINRCGLGRMDSETESAAADDVAGAA